MPMRICTRIAKFLRKLLILEIILLGVVAVVWFLTGWHDTDSYGLALVRMAQATMALGLLIVFGSRGSGNIKAAEGEMEMRSMVHRTASRFKSGYAEIDKIAVWMLLVGFLALLIGALLNSFSLGLFLS